MITLILGTVMNMKAFYTKRKDVKKLYKLAWIADQVLIKYNIPYWAIAGTLIGAKRHKGIIPWDDDVDIAVKWKDFKRLRENKQVHETFEEYKCKVYVQKKGIMKIYLENSKPIFDYPYLYPFLDIFPMRKKEGKYEYFYSFHRSGWSNEYFYTSELFPLKRTKFGKYSISVPNKSNKYLSRSFGKNWKSVGKICQNHYTEEELDEPILVYDFAPAKPFYTLQ